MALYAWDEPPETLLELGPKADVQLVMPRLGEPIEPAHAERVEPWWRDADTVGRQPEPDARREATVPKTMPWPID